MKTRFLLALVLLFVLSACANVQPLLRGEQENAEHQLSIQAEPDATPDAEAGADASTNADADGSDAAADAGANADSDTDANADADTADDASSTKRMTVRFVVNINSDKIHRPNCHCIDTLLPKNRLETDENLATLHSQGYVDCKVCKPGG